MSHVQISKIRTFSIKLGVNHLGPLVMFWSLMTTVCGLTVLGEIRMQGWTMHVEQKILEIYKHWLWIK